MSISIFQPPPIPINEAERGAAVSASGALKTLDDPILLKITRAVCVQMRVSTSLLSILHGDTQYVVAANGFVTGAYRRQNSFSGHAVASGEDLFFVPDLLADDRFADNPWVNGDAGRFRFYSAALIRLDGKHAIGAISAIDPAPRSNIGTADREALLTATRAAATRLQQLRIA
jgi:GAF domain-containing protein